MDKIKKTENAIVLRTDFSSEITWKRICKEIEKPIDHPMSVLFTGYIPAEEWRAHVTFINDRQYNDASLQQIIPLIDTNAHWFFFVVDHITITNPELPILCVDLSENPGDTFRVTPNRMAIIESNLSIANVGFSELAELADHEGIYRDSELWKDMSEHLKDNENGIK